jgi:hypothetical protein
MHRDEKSRADLWACVKPLAVHLFKVHEWWSASQMGHWASGIMLDGSLSAANSRPLELVLVPHPSPQCVDY